MKLAITNNFAEFRQVVDWIFDVARLQTDFVAWGRNERMYVRLALEESDSRWKEFDELTKNWITERTPDDYHPSPARVD